RRHGGSCPDGNWRSSGSCRRPCPKPAGRASPTAMTRERQDFRKLASKRGPPNRCRLGPRPQTEGPRAMQYLSRTLPRLTAGRFPGFGSLLSALLAADARFRARRHAETLTEDALRDVGLT